MFQKMIGSCLNRGGPQRFSQNAPGCASSARFQQGLTCKWELKAFSRYRRWLALGRGQGGVRWTAGHGHGTSERATRDGHLLDASATDAGRKQLGEADRPGPGRKRRAGGSQVQAKLALAGGSSRAGLTGLAGME